MGDFERLDGAKNGVLEAISSFTLCWAGKLPATAFPSSYTLGLHYPHSPFLRLLARLSEERGAPEITIATIFRAAVPCICLQWIGLGLCIVFPQIVLLLPSPVYTR